jgi:UDP-N-acetylmuramoyl-tripeptide--D-alanyl-D-alanine ligase
LNRLSIQEAASAIGADIWGDVSGSISGVCTDTREGAKGKLFFALMGENADGHNFVARALQEGASAAVVGHHLPNVPGAQLVVNDALVALGLLAKWHRSRFDLPVIGITGSVGKTSTKEMIALALGGNYNVLVSERNFNNEIGVPKALLDLNEEHTAAVIEMAMRGPGQIAWLAEIARPTVGVITNIGLSHIELLKSRDGIAAAKAEILLGLPPDGIAVVNADDEYCEFLKDSFNGRSITFGFAEVADFRVTDMNCINSGASTFRVNGQRFTIHAPGVHHPINAAAACAVAETLRVAPAEIAERLSSFRSPAMRMECLELPNDITILNDAYNAAPDSMRSALETLRVMGASDRRIIAVLGEMRELGEYARQAHRYVGEIVAGTNPDVLITVGSQAIEIANTATNLGYRGILAAFQDSSEVASAITGVLETGDLVLIKGSRALEMEQIVAVIAAAGGVDLKGIVH